ncbi:MAG: hypothetical protein OEU94_02340 [Aquincola sp.]|nr:hypothetical protein [Aquincola sp.]MDH4289082.1 hypothetical protein [Aquincola sp.]
MTRCALALMAALAIALPAHAQRVFERDALRGELVVTAPPLALLNGKPARLAPGARIRNAQNLLQLTGSILEQKLLVHYTVDGFGQLQNVWILTEAEAAKRPWPTTVEEATRWSFDPTRQVWVKP